MKLYVGKLSEAFCESLLTEIKTHTVDPIHGFMTLPEDNPFYSSIADQTQMLSDAGYNDHTVEYKHYQAGKHFHKNHLANLISICESCHTNIHELGLVFEKRKTVDGINILEGL